MVDHLPRHPKVEDSRSATNTGTEGDRKQKIGQSLDDTKGLSYNNRP
jgi:hypothetical protein